MRQYDFEISCPHEADSTIPSYKTYPDYHPLTTEEIRDLLDFAKAHKGDAVAVSKVQVRLNQGVEGCACPRTVGDDNARRRTELDRIFMECFKLGGVPDSVEVMETLMKG